MSPHARLHTAKVRLEAALDRPILDRLSPEERAETLSLLLIELQRRIGLDLMKTLDDASKRKFGLLMEREADSDELTAFFSVRIPDYRERVERAVESFCDECGESLDYIARAEV